VCDLDLVRDEVRRYSADLAGKPQLVAATKRDLAGEDDPLPALRRAAGERGLEVVPVSAATGEGLLLLKRRILGTLAAAAVAQPLEESA
jgi:GTP-binding protein